ncbi:MAG: exodeoxyribonuclease VII large subunit [Rikenellaceae bacterium]
MGEAITLYKLQQKVKGLLKSSFTSGVWVVAEIAQINIASTGHCYIELIERNDTTQSLVAKCSATLWRGSVDAVFRRFLSATGYQISSGMKILAHVDVSYHELYGLSLNINDIDPSYTLGELEMARRATIKRLTDDGDMERNRSIPFPTLPQRVAVISSEKAAGFGDFMDELLLNEYNYSFEVELFNSIMQGNDAEQSIISAFSSIYNRYEEFDVIVIIRGGGSSTDLSCFDSYALSKTASYSPLPIISGIGHDRDSSILDMLTAVSLKTPTAVARYLIDKVLDCETALNELEEYFKDIFLTELKFQQDKILSASHELKMRVDGMVKENSIYLGKVEQQLHYGVKIATERELRVNDNYYNRLKGVRDRIKESEKRISSNFDVLNFRAKFALDSAVKTIELQRVQIDGFNPKNIFKLGYSLAKIRGKAIRSVSEVEKGDNIDVNFNDGVVKAAIVEVIVND